MKNSLPTLPQTDLCLCFYDEGGIQELDGRAYTEEQMYDFYKQRKPLTCNQIWESDDIMKVNGGLLGLSMNELVQVVKAVERAHGITEKQEEPIIGKPSYVSLVKPGTVLNSIDAGDCELCHGSGEVSISPDGTDQNRDYYGCPLCISREHANEVAELKNALAGALRKLELASLRPA